MRKYGKYEQMPDGTRAKQPPAKSLLLQTYMTSLLCLILCVTMFFGTSFAWFTSEVNNVGNEIYIGTLKVGLLKENGTETPDNLADSNKKLFDSNIRWEPGYTALETIKVVNEGDLAFNYNLTFTDGNVNGTVDSKMLKSVAENFVVYVHVGDYVQDESYNNFEAIKTSEKWKPVMNGDQVATLAQILENKLPVLEGKMTDVRGTVGTDAALPGPNDSKATADTYIIALHMKEETESQGIMGHKLTLNVKLMAYQRTSEMDGLGSSAYDSELMIAANAKELKEVLADSKNVILASDIKLTNTDECVTMSAATFDGNGKVITYNGGRVNESSVGVVTTSGGKISNLTINGNDNGRALYVTKLTSDLVVSDCTFSGAYSFNLNSAAKNENAIISFIDTTFNSWTSYANVAKHAYFTGCKFGGVLKPYGDTTMTNCIITTQGLDVSALEAGEAITLINCTYNGQLIERAVLTSNGEVVTISESNAIQVDADKMVVLKGKG